MCIICKWGGPLLNNMSIHPLLTIAKSLLECLYSHRDFRAWFILAHEHFALVKDSLLCVLVMLVNALCVLFPQVLLLAL